MVTWGTSPEMVAPITGCTPIPEDQKDPVKREGWERAYQYMDLKPGTPMTSIAPNNVFIGSCTNGRIEDIRAAAYVVRKLGKKVVPTVKQALVVPGSGLVREQAEDEGWTRFLLKPDSSGASGLLDVFGDECRPLRAGRPLCLNQQPKLRRAPRQ